jgi:Domain of unknown function (DUF4214)/Beta-propeller repeat
MRSFSMAARCAGTAAVLFGVLGFPLVAQVSVPAIAAAFEPNRGQTTKEFDFVAKGLGYAVGLSGPHVTIVQGRAPGSPAEAVTFNLVGATKGLEGQPLDKMKSINSYFIGDLAITGIPTFGKVRYDGIWPGVDVVYYGNGQKLEYDFIVAAGADPSVIRMQFDGVKSVRNSPQGDLLLKTATSQMVQAKPVAYQVSGSTRTPVPASYRIHGDSVEIKLGKYDRSKELVIDPVFLFTVAGLQIDPVHFSLSASSTASDTVTDSYVAGWTVPFNNGTGTFAAAFCTELDISGNQLAKTEYGFTAGNAYATGVAVDSNGFVYLLGHGDTAGGHQFGFLNKYPPGLGQVQQASFGITADGDVLPSNLALNGQIAYIVGESTSIAFPVSASLPTPPNGFAIAFDTTGLYANPSTPATQVYSIAIGGSGSDAALGVAVDKNSNAYVGGLTTSTDFQPTIGAASYISSKANANLDGFLVRLDPTGALVWGTFFPGGPVNAVAQLRQQVSIVGQTTGSIATTSTAYQMAGLNANPNHAFMAQLNTNVSGSTALTYSTYLSGSGTDEANAVAVSGNAKVYISGVTTSANFPIAGTPAPVQSTFVGGSIGEDGFFSIIDPTQSGTPGLLYSTFVGPDGNTIATGVSVDGYNHAAVSATSYSSITAPLIGSLYKYGNSIIDPAFFVSQQYLDLLDRPVDPNGLTYWVNMLNSGTTRGVVAREFFVSPEFANGGLAIIQDYLAVLGRNPDYNGWLFWFNIYIGGESPSTILLSFLSSPEFQNTYGNLNNTDFVNLVYQNVLGRPADPNGLNYWVTMLQNGTTRVSVFSTFLASPEFQTRIAPKAYANLLYMGFLRRTGDLSGLAYWTAMLQDPTNDLPSVCNLFISSPEYFNRFN